MEKNDLSALEETLGYYFENKLLLEYALTHKTYAFEASAPLEYNERLEFLGDSILNFVVAEQLYKTNKYFSEGELTRRRSGIVNNDFLAKRAHALGLGRFLRLGKGAVKQEGHKNRTTLANTFEAIIGAIYLDAGLDDVRTFILRHILTENSI